MTGFSPNRVRNKFIVAINAFPRGSVLDDTILVFEPVLEPAPVPEFGFELHGVVSSPRFMKFEVDVFGATGDTMYVGETQGFR